MLPDLSAVPPGAAACLIALTTVTTAFIALTRAFVRALPQTASERLEFWRELLSYRLKVRKLKDARRARRRTPNPRISSGDTDAVRTGDDQHEDANP